MNAAEMTETEQRVFLPGPGVNDIQNDHDDDDQEEPVLPKLNEEFKKFPLVTYMQYSLRLYEILRDMDRMHHRMDVFLGALGCTPRDIGVSEPFLHEDDDDLEDETGIFDLCSSSIVHRSIAPTTSDDPAGPTT